MKDRMRKTRFMALVLSVMMVLTTTFNGVTVYAGSPETGWTLKSDSQAASASDSAKAVTATASDPEQKQKNTGAKEMTEEELYELSDEGKLTKAVLTGIGAIEPQEMIDVNQYVDFTCIVDDEDDQVHTDLKDYVMNDLQITSLKSGSLESAAPKTISYNGHNHMYRRAVVGNTPVYYAGVLNVGGNDYVYYVTSQKNTDRTVYSVLKDGETIDLMYVHKNAYKIEYELDNESTVGDSDLTADEVFGEDRIEAVEDKGSYTFKVQIPRGYKATVEVVDEDGSGKRASLVGSSRTLGEMIQYDNTPVNHNVIRKADSPEAMILNGTYESDQVECDQKVIVSYKKVTKFTFSAEAWLQTQYANGNEQRITKTTAKGTFGDNHSYTWTFTGNSTQGSTFEMNQLELNGEAIEVPMVTMKDTQTVTNKTVLSTGTEVTVSVQSNNGQNGSSAERDYTVQIDNCYEDITVSGGNMVGHQHKEIAVRRLIGVSAQYAKTGTAPSAENSWTEIESDSLIVRKGEYANNDTFRFKTDIGYGKPDIRILPKDALTTLQENGNGSYIEYLCYSSSEAGETVQTYDSWTPSYDGNYYFRTTTALKNYMENSDAQGVVLLEIQGIPTKVGVDYISGGGLTDESGKLISPNPANIVNMPGFDDGGTNGYNTVNNVHVPISSTVPRDLSGNFEFAYWQVVKVGDDGSLGDLKEDAIYAPGQRAHLTEESFQDLSDCYHWDEAKNRTVFTLQAVWKSENVDTPISYVVHYYVDGQEIYAETHTANKGAKVIVDAWKADKESLSNAMESILRGNNYAGKDYTESGTKRYIIDRTQSTEVLDDLQLDNNTLKVYFVTADTQWKLQKQWIFAAASGQPESPADELRVQIQRKTADASAWENVPESDGGVIELNVSGNWKAEPGKLPIYADDDVTRPYTYRSVELDGDGAVIEDGSTVDFGTDAQDPTAKRTFLVNYQKQGDTWTILNAETPTGALKVSNTVSGAQGDQEKDWNFTVAENTKNGAEPVDGTFGGMTFHNGTAKFSLKHGESMIAVGLPAGSSFTVTEKEANTDGYVSTCNDTALDSQGRKFTIAADSTVTADIHNKKDLSTVSVFLHGVKYVNLMTPSDAQKFTFCLKDESGRQIQAVQNNKTQIDFQALEFSEAGDYTYYIMENNGGDKNVQYSELVYEADIHVEEVQNADGNSFQASVTYKVPGGGNVELPEFRNEVNADTLTSVRVVKHWNDGENADRPDMVWFQLYKTVDGEHITEGEPVSVSADSNGIWSYTWENLDKDTVWDVEEINIPDGYEIESRYQEDNEWTFTNCLKPDDPPAVTSLTVQKVWDDENSEKRPASVSVQLYKDGDAYGEIVTLSADENWTYTWSDLDASAAWTVDEAEVPDGYERELSSEGNSWTITNKLKADDIPKPAETVSVTADKVWEDADDANRPDSVKFQLYRDGEAYGEAVTVTADQGWRYIWTGLEKDHAWTVQEAEHIDGYKVSIGHNGDNWVITNTKISSGDNSGDYSGDHSQGSDSDDSDDSGDSCYPSTIVIDNKRTAVADSSSQKGTDPSAADTNGNADKNAVVVAPPDPFVKSGRPTADSADAKNMRKKDSNVPATGDVTHSYLWFLIAGISLTGLLALILGKEHSDRRRKS